MIDSQAIEIHRRLPAPIGEVFRWWTDPDLLKEWMTPIGTVEADVDLRVGGRLRVVMKGDGRVIEHTGEYLEIDAPRRLVFTWVSPFTGSVPSLITVELRAAGDDLTDLRLVHALLPDEAARWHRGGWDAMLERLGGRLREKRGALHGGGDASRKSKRSCAPQDSAGTSGVAPGRCQRMPSQSWRSFGAGSVTMVPPTPSKRITVRSRES